MARHPISKIAALVLVAPLAGTMLLAAPASAVPAKAPAAVSQKADGPSSSFDVRVVASNEARTGGKVSYTIRATNKGPNLADSFFVGGVLPKGSRIVQAYGPKDAECDTYSDGFWCWYPDALEIDDKAAIKIVVKLGKSSKGSAVAVLGVDTVELPDGTKNLKRDEFERLGIKSWYFVKKVTTKITH